ncbi:MAG TPA: hypothetical protein VFN79_13890 [Steroidobacteraceae bacterium]|nr:hypothetical protein [Steroidobacteraceae bacterium]
MRRAPKVSQLQLRLSREEKAAVRLAARRAGMDMSAYVMSRVLPAPATMFQEALAALSASGTPSFALAELNALLSGLSTPELRHAVAAAPEAALTPFLANYVAAMVEVACNRHTLPAPAWTADVAALEEPAFGSTLPSLRLHLLTHSPGPFRRRNIFIDSSIGGRV